MSLCAEKAEAEDARRRNSRRGRLPQCQGLWRSGRLRCRQLAWSLLLTGRLSAVSADMGIASRRGSVAEVQRLIADGATLDSRVDAGGHTALHEAALEGHAPVADVLLTAGASVDAVDIHRQTALHWAALGGHAEVTQTLLSHRASADAVDSEGRAALHSAASQGHADIIQALLDAGGDPTITDVHGHDPHWWARHRHFSDLVHTLHLARRRWAGLPEVEETTKRSATPRAPPSTGVQMPLPVPPVLQATSGGADPSSAALEAVDISSAAAAAAEVTLPATMASPSMNAPIDSFSAAAPDLSEAAEQRRVAMQLPQPSSQADDGPSSASGMTDGGAVRFGGAHDEARPPAPPPIPPRIPHGQQGIVPPAKNMSSQSVTRITSSGASMLSKPQPASSEADGSVAAPPKPPMPGARGRAAREAMAAAAARRVSQQQQPAAASHSHDL
eukprot:TRINITY_DN9072_c0_g1_i2.p1 TRINITY_DN9072_c0_g1~~TRINITY_DN9072_c0_g1_i2.p1  ORF type:complete len:445 (-),score=103.14 TRINITY_DN9072_c0_g1_i2:162-1496(-)